VAQLLVKSEEKGEKMIRHHYHNHRILQVSLFSQFICSAVLLAILTGCSHIELKTYRSPDLGKYRIEKVAIMPLVITSSAQTRVSGSYSPSWISETFTTTALSPAEYFSAEEEMVNTLSSKLGRIKFVTPSVIDNAMKGKKIQTYHAALLEVVKHFNADAVISFRIRDVILRAGSQIEGRSAAMGHVDLTLYGSEGSPLWSVSSESVYRRGTAFSQAPSMASFVKYIMEEYQGEIEALAKQLNP
jgi:hypothetical protein